MAQGDSGPHRLALATMVAVLAVSGAVAVTQLGPAPPLSPPPSPPTSPPPTSVASGTPLAELDAVDPVVLPAPPFENRPASPPDPPAGPTLPVVSTARNGIVDTEAWFASNELSVPRRAADQAPAEIPRSYRGAALTEVIEQPEATFLLYGGELPTVLVALDRGSGEVAYALDFTAYARAPEALPGEEAFVGQQLGWARQVDDVLYVSHGHRTYARSSRGANAYVTAVEVPSGRVLWHSAPLVSNALTFEVVGGHLVAGYGFTAEDDFLHVLDRSTGVLVRSVPLASAPEYVIRKDGDVPALYVRCYDTDYVFALDA